LKHIKQRLEEENQQLKLQLAQAHQELANLRRGIGISVTIEGKTVLSGLAQPLPDVILPISTNAQPAYATPAVVGNLQRQHPVQSTSVQADAVSPTSPNLFGNRNSTSNEGSSREQSSSTGVPNPNYFL